MKKAVFNFRTFFVGQINSKIKRYLRARKNSKNKSGGRLIPAIHIKEALLKLPKRFFIFSIIIFIIFSLFFLFKTYYEIQTFAYNEISTNQFSPKLINRNDYNVGLYGYESRGGYKYVTFSALISVDKESINVVQVSPLFVSPNNNELRIHTILNEEEKIVKLSSLLDILTKRIPLFFIPINLNISSKNLINIENISESSNIYKLNEIMSSVLGLRVDRYLIFENSELLKNINEFNYSKDLYKAYDFERIEDVFSTNNIENSNQNNAQLEFIVSLIEDNFGFWDKVNYFFNSKKFTNIFSTDMTRRELIQFVNSLNKDKKIDSLVLGRNEGFLLEKSDIYFSPNNIFIDEKIIPVFSNIDIIAEQAEVEIYNATNVRGFASKKTRLFQNIGVNVVKFGNYFEPINTNILFLTDESDLSRFNVTINSIKQKLRNNLEIKIGEYRYNRTGDLVLVLGQE